MEVRVVTVYDIHKGYDIELNSLITSGRDWNERKHIVSYKTVITVNRAYNVIHSFKKIAK